MKWPRTSKTSQKDFYRISSITNASYSSRLLVIFLYLIVFLDSYSLVRWALSFQ